MSGVPVVVPRVNANDDQVELVRRIAAQGARVAKGEAICEVATTKAAIVVEAPESGFISWRAEEGATVDVAQEIGHVVATAEAVETAAGERSSGKAASVVAFRLSREAERAFAAAGVAPESVGAAGLVTAADAERLLGRVRIESPDFVKRAEIKTLERSSSVLASTVTVTVPGLPQPALPAVIAAGARCLRDFPHLNAWYSDGQLFIYERVDAGVAMDLGRGLRVVVVPRADELSAADIAARLEDLTLRYLDGALAAEDMSQATFTVTDLSGLGAAAFQPLIGDRQAAILGLSGGPAAGTPYQLTLVFDHRAANGRMAAMFLSDLAERLQEGVVAPAAAAPAAAHAAPAAPGALPAGCDRCAIEVAAYYREFPRDGFMQVYVRADGSQGLMCHRCSEGFF